MPNHQTALYIAKKYTFSPHRNRFSKLTQNIAIYATALGIATLLIITSIFNGFYRELMQHFHERDHHITANTTQDAVWQDTMDTIASRQDIQHVYPLQTRYAVITQGDTIYPLILQGIHPSYPPKWYQHKPTKIQKEHIIPAAISYDLVDKLYLEKDDTFSLFTANAKELKPQALRVSYQDSISPNADNPNLSQVIIPLEAFNQTFGYQRQAIQQLVIQVHDPLKASQIRASLQAKYPDWQFHDWTLSMKALFGSLLTQKKLMAIVLGLVITMASFNLIAGLIITIHERKKEIAVLRTLGFTKRDIGYIFLYQCLSITTMGIVLGLTIGIPCAYYVDTIIQALESLLGYTIISDQVFMLNHLPSEINPWDVTSIVAITILLALLAAWMPIRQATAIEPAEVLRYE